LELLTTIIDYFFEYSTVVFLFINAVLFLFSYKQKDKAYQYFSWYLVFICVIQITGFILASYTIRNLFLSHFYFWGQLLFLSAFYKSIFKKTQHKWIHLSNIIVAIILLLQYITQPYAFNRFNTLEVFLCSFPLVVFSLMHLTNTLTGKSKYMFINAGILMYLTTSSLIFILGDFLSAMTKSEMTDNIWFINKVLYVVYLVLIFIEWKHIRSLKSKS
jgi:hypothetical protein